MRSVSSICRRKMHQLYPIRLESAESQVCETLLRFCASYNSGKGDQQKLELRITGGWVRDKLLGKQSHDLDIAVNQLSGEEFASQLLAFMAAQDPGVKTQSVHTIKKNPDKSKHLETCTTKLFGLDIDFVNLRSEKYTAASRVPIIECGTAEEDALRRDATLNALFYNLNHDKIEDFTGRGLDDLRNGVLRTPLAPYQTFLDDPLRVLRLIRFSSTFNFVIEPHTLAAMSDETIRTALVHKISRERVGVELEKILVGANPIYGLRLVSAVGLTNSIFSVGVLQQTVSDINSPEKVALVARRAARIDAQISAISASFDLFASLVRADHPRLHRVLLTVLGDQHWQKLFFLAAVLLPYETATVRANAKRPVESSVPGLILKEGLRFGKNDFDPVSTIVREHEPTRALFADFFTHGALQRLHLGTALAKFKSFSPLAVLVYAYAELLQCPEFQVALLKDPEPLPFTVSGELSQRCGASLQKYEALMKHIDEEQLWEVHNLKPLIDGKALSQEFSRKPGPWMREATDQIVIWQLDHPQGTAEECMADMRGRI